MLVGSVIRSFCEGVDIGGRSGRGWGSEMGKRGQTVEATTSETMPHRTAVGTMPLHAHVNASCRTWMLGLLYGMCRKANVSLSTFAVGSLPSSYLQAGLV